MMTPEERRMKAIKTLATLNQKYLEKPVAVRGLKLAKAYSDVGDYGNKHAVMEQLLRARPGEFDVDSRADGIVGLTHRPTNFRIHVPVYLLAAMDNLPPPAKNSDASENPTLDISPTPV